MFEIENHDSIVNLADLLSVENPITLNDFFFSYTRDTVDVFFPRKEISGRIGILNKKKKKPTSDVLNVGRCRYLPL